MSFLPVKKKLILKLKSSFQALEHVDVQCVPVFHQICGDNITEIKQSLTPCGKYKWNLLGTTTSVFWSERLSCAVTELSLHYYQRFFGPSVLRAPAEQTKVTTVFGN